MKKTKKPKSNTLISQAAKFTTVEYENAYNREMRLLCLEKLGIELVEYALNNSKCFSIESFLRHKGIYHDDYYGWIDISVPLRKSHEYAKIIIADRLNEGAIEKKYDATHVRFQLPKLSKHWQELHEYHAKLKADNAESGGTKIVVIDKFPDPIDIIK